MWCIVMRMLKRISFGNCQWWYHSVIWTCWTYLRWLQKNTQYEFEWIWFLNWSRFYKAHIWRERKNKCSCHDTLYGDATHICTAFFSIFYQVNEVNAPRSKSKWYCALVRNLHHTLIVAHNTNKMNMNLMFKSRK